MAVRWGIAGTGAIASGMAMALAEVDDAVVTAVGSRTVEAATAFASQWSVPNTHGSYEGLAADDDVDVVYVATPHSRHRDDTLLYLGAGRHVLCEKAFAMDAAQAEEMVAAARAADRFCMEAMWTRFHPAVEALSQALAEGEIGEPRTLRADFGFRHEGSPDDRHLSAALGGGALLDKGVYPVSLGFHLFGAPRHVAAHGRIGSTGVDTHVGGLLAHERGAVTLFDCSLEAMSPLGAQIVGTEGWITVAPPFWATDRFTVQRHGESPSERVFGPASLAHEARHVHACLAEGRRESPVMPLDESVAIMGALDDIRSQVASDP